MDGFAKSLKRWWARKDSNLRPMDYESTVVDGLSPYIDWVHTITYDNGREFADHEGGVLPEL